jgi:hypothetical protein
LVVERIGSISDKMRSTLIGCFRGSSRIELAVGAKWVRVAARVARSYTAVNGFCLNFLEIEPNWYRFPGFPA